MHYQILGVVVVVFAVTAPAYGQDAPSNAELFRMLKEQHKTIKELTAEVRRSRAELSAERARKGVAGPASQVTGRQERQTDDGLL